MTLRRAIRLSLFAPLCLAFAACTQYPARPEVANLSDTPLRVDVYQGAGMTWIGPAANRRVSSATLAPGEWWDGKQTEPSIGPAPTLRQINMPTLIRVIGPADAPRVWLLSDRESAIVLLVGRAGNVSAEAIVASPDRLKRLIRLEPSTLEWFK